MNFAPLPVWQLEAQLGEGPVWLPDEAALRFVDIKRGLLHRFDPASGLCETFEVGGKPSFIVPDACGGLLVGSEHSVFRLEDNTLGAKVTAIPQPSHNRTNDATVDARGRLWFGTMDDREQGPSGCVWCLDRGTLHRAGGEAVVTNGPAVSGDGRFLYHVDTGGRTIWRFEIGELPELTRGEVFLRLDEDDGHPDGIVMDSENCLWVALWDGWGVRRYSAEGRLMQHVTFPCARVTKLAFGGTELRTAFVTTARTGLDEAALSKQPLAGSLFAFEVPVAGQVLPHVQLT